MRGRLTTGDPWRYLIALGSNVRHQRFGAAREVIAAALGVIAEEVRVEAVSPVIQTPPLGPSRRRYANAAAVIATSLGPEKLLDRLQRIERHFGRRRTGRRWRARVIDVDLILWSAGSWSSRRLTIPHPAFRDRAFVLTPAVRVAPGWRDPVSGLTVRQLKARLTRATPLH